MKNIDQKLAPITLFVYNRLWHTKKTVNALKENDLAKSSELYIFSDGPKTSSSIENVRKVRNYINRIEGFKKVHIIERNTNWGLANSIIDGVTKIINIHNKIIVIEDDLVTSNNFLRFMNDALNKYEHEKKLWHISGWNYDIDPSGLEDVFFWKVANSWTWATWADRWKHFDKNPDKYIDFFTEQQIRKINLDGYKDFWTQMVYNKNGKLNTWNIFWYAEIFKNNGICMNPVLSLVKNIGNDGSGENCGVKLNQSKIISNKQINIMPNKVNETKLAIERLKQYFKNNNSNLFQRVLMKLLKVIIKLRNKLIYKLSI